MKDSLRRITRREEIKIEEEGGEAEEEEEDGEEDLRINIIRIPKHYSK